MLRALAFFDGRAEIIAARPAMERLASLPEGEASSEAIIALLRRRPCTAADVAPGLGLHINNAIKLLAALREAGRITSWRSGDGRVLYCSRPNGGESGAAH